MTNNLNGKSSDNEDWGAYRKLIVDTLRRLSDSIEDLRNEQNEHQNKLYAVEINNKQLDTKVSILETDIASLKTDSSANKVGKQYINTIANAVWGVVVIIIATVINNAHIFH